MERVKKGEKYWCIDRGLGVGAITESGSPFDEQMFEIGNYFVSENEAIRISNSLRAVLKGAEVIEMPSEEELRGFVKGVGKVSEETAYVLMKYYRWLKEKIVK